MRHVYTKVFLLVAACVVAVNLEAQSTESTTPGGDNRVIAIGYLVNGGASKVDLRGTGSLPQASGEAKVEARDGVTLVEAKVENLAQPGKIATEFLTYVLWAVSPDGRTNNLGEILIDEKGKGKLKTTTQLQTFSLFVTSEPYLSVRWPSEIVVLKNEPRENTMGKRIVVDQYRLMKRSHYEKQGNPLALAVDTKTVPLQMYEARNAFEIAKSHGAEKYAPEIFAKAQSTMSVAEGLVQQQSDKKEIISAARQTMQFSEDARALAADRQEQEKIAMERQLAVEAARNEAEARAEVQVAAKGTETDMLRQELLRQLSLVLETRDTPRGLVVNMADVLFDTGKYELRPEAREKLAKLSGILAIHPGLQVEVEGHTDTTGSEELNQVLSEKRAESVGQFLAEEGVAAENIRARGMGDAYPVAENSTVRGRQQNRRVEIIVSGEVIGRTIESKPRISN